MTEHETPTFNLPRPRPSRPVDYDMPKHSVIVEPKLTREQAVLEREFDEVWLNFYDYFIPQPSPTRDDPWHLLDPVFKPLFEDCLSISRTCYEADLFNHYSVSSFLIECIYAMRLFQSYIHHVARKDLDNPVHDIELMCLSNNLSFKSALSKVVTSPALYENPIDPYRFLRSHWRFRYRKQWREDLLVGHYGKPPAYSISFLESKLNAYK